MKLAAVIERDNKENMTGYHFEIEYDNLFDFLNKVSSLDNILDNREVVKILKKVIELEEYREMLVDKAISERINKKYRMCN